MYNSRWILERAVRDYSLRLDAENIKVKSEILYQSLKNIRTCETSSRLLGLEGEAASVYFSVFDDLILQQKEEFYFHGRNKRPPLDPVNAMLLSHTVYWQECAEQRWKQLDWMRM